MNRYAIIMAGGSGKRLFPVSTEERPKQFLKLYGNEIMINQTIKRIEKTIPLENIFIVINKKHKEIAEKCIDSRIKESNILIEPKKCNTAACICYATTYIVNKYGKGVIAVFSSDHYIEEQEKFDDTLNKALKYVEKDNSLLVLGIKPTFPSQQFGYINYEDEDIEIKKVKDFKEKPDLKKAENYIKNGYVWNSGIFIWNAETIEKAFIKYLPTMYEKFDKIKKYFDTDMQEEKLEEIYKTLESISIDFGIIEKADNVKMILADFKWMDIGNMEQFLMLKQKKLFSNL